MHWTFLTTVPTPGDSRGNERGFDRSAGGVYPGFVLYRQKVSEMKKTADCRENSSGFNNEQSQQSGAFSGTLLDQKSMSPAIPRGGGRGYK